MLRSILSHRVRALALLSAAAFGLACQREAAPVRVQAPADAATLFVSVRLVADGRVALDRAGTVLMGQPVEMVGTGHGDEPPMVVTLWVQHYAARPDAFSVRVTLLREGQVLFAPVLTARPGEPARFEASVDERVLALELTVDLADRAAARAGP